MNITDSLLSTVSQETGISFTCTGDTVTMTLADAFKLAAITELAHRNVDNTFTAGLDVPSVIRSHNVVVAREKLIEAGRKSWVTRRINACKNSKKCS